MAKAPDSVAPLNVILLDDNQARRELLGAALHRHARIAVTSGPVSAPLLWSDLLLSVADVAVLSHPFDESCCEALQRLHSHFPRIPIVLFLDTFDRKVVIGALRLGVRGLFCGSSMPIKALYRCIDVVRNGQVWINTEQVQYLIDALPMNPHVDIVNANGKALLCHREQEVAALVVQGLTNRDIALQLHISENTVKKSILHIYDKLGVSNRVELTLYAVTPRYSQSQPESLFSAENEEATSFLLTTKS